MYIFHKEKVSKAFFFILIKRKFVKCQIFTKNHSKRYRFATKSLRTSPLLQDISIHQYHIFQQRNLPKKTVITQQSRPVVTLQRARNQLVHASIPPPLIPSEIGRSEDGTRTWWWKFEFLCNGHAALWGW